MSSILTELGSAIRAVAETTSPSIVGVGRGSGIVIEPGRVLTNAHNLRHDETRVGFADGRTERGTVLGFDPDADLAIVEVDTGDTPAVAWAEEPPLLGDAVFTLANPRGRGVRVTFGTVSSTTRAFRGPRGRVIGDALEHTAPLARGSSGGPIVDASGALLGINTHRRGDGFYLAIPATADLRSHVSALTKGETPKRRRLGVAVAPPHAARRMRAAVGLEPRDGLLVRGVEDGGPAARAGVRRGDLLIGANDTDLARAEDLYGVLDGLDGEATLTLRLLRGTEAVDVAVTFGDTVEEGSA